MIVTVRMQLLWMDFAAAQGYYHRHVLPAIRESWSGSNVRLRRITILRENYHSRRVRFEITLDDDKSLALCAQDDKHLALSADQQDDKHLTLSADQQDDKPLAFAADQQDDKHLVLSAKQQDDKPLALSAVQHDEKPLSMTAGHNPLALFVDVKSSGYQLDYVREETRSSEVSIEQRFAVLRAAMRNNRDATPIIPPTTSFDFWQSSDWWDNKVNAYWFTSPLRSNRRRVVHMLNQLMRVLRHVYRLDVASGLRILNRLDSRQIDFIDRVFVEPTNGSLIVSHLSTIFMHNKQQTGLNMKHEANKQTSVNTKRLQSDRAFDPKIYLKMSTSCVKRDIFELMIRVSLRSHEPACCACTSCTQMRDLSNAWRYYDCHDHAWLRLEFPRKSYQAVCELLQDHREDYKLVFSSDKNEFQQKELFIENFVNYYAFYENEQHPLVVSQCDERMRNNVSILYLFAQINWVMIENSRQQNRNNSISLNQQSLCKSLNNTLYSIFSENCINRVRGERSRRVISDNAAYVNRGLGIVPNTGVNAFNTSHSLTLPLYEDEIPLFEPMSPIYSPESVDQMMES